MMKRTMGTRAAERVLAPSPAALASDGATTRSVAFCLVTIFLGAALSW